MRGILVAHTKGGHHLERQEAEGREGSVLSSNNPLSMELTNKGLSISHLAPPPEQLPLSRIDSENQALTHNLWGTTHIHTLAIP